MQCDHAVNVSADLSLWLDSPMFWTPEHQNMSTYLLPAVFCTFISHLEKVEVWMCKLGVISQERLKTEVKLLLSATRKSYMPRQWTQQRMTLNDLEWFI